MLDIVLSLVVLAAVALLAGAWFAWKRGHAKQAGLMVLLAVVALLNIAIWVAPMESGEAPLDAVERSAT